MNIKWEYAKDNQGDKMKVIFGVTLWVFMYFVLFFVAPREPREIVFMVIGAGFVGWHMVGLIYKLTEAVFGP